MERFLCSEAQQLDKVAVAAETKRAYLALFPGPAEKLDCLLALYMFGSGGTVNQQAVDIIRFQSTEACLQVSAHPLQAVRFDLGVYHDLLAFVFENLTHQALILAVIVSPAGIKEIYPFLKGIADQSRIHGPAGAKSDFSHFYF